MLSATARSIPGTLRQDVLIDGRHHLRTDEPERLGGEGTAPAPHELFPAALASCVSTTIVMYARTKGWDVGEVTVDVAYDTTASPRRFDVVVRVGGDLDDDQVERLGRVGASCPVRRAVESGIVFEERIERAAQREASPLARGRP